MSELTEDKVIAALRRTWQPVANAADLPAGEILSYQLLETRLVVARFPDGHLLAADVNCPHKGASLAAGCFRNGHLMCPYHGWEFSAEGQCQSIPSLLEATPEKLELSHLRNYRIQERYGFVWVKLDDAPMGDGTVHELPSVPEFEDPHPLPVSAGGEWERPGTRRGDADCGEPRQRLAR